MKKNIVILLSIITILVCIWQFINCMQFLDIPSNKNDTAASWQKRKIADDVTIDACQKRILINEIDNERKSERANSAIAFQTQFILLIIIGTQIVLLVFIFLMPKKVKLIT